MKKNISYNNKNNNNSIIPINPKNQLNQTNITVINKEQHNNLPEIKLNKSYNNNLELTNKKDKFYDYDNIIPVKKNTKTKRVYKTIVTQLPLNKNPCIYMDIIPMQNWHPDYNKIFDNNFWGPLLYHLSSESELIFNTKEGKNFFLGGGSYSKVFIGSLDNKEYAIKIIIIGNSKEIKQYSMKESTFTLNIKSKYFVTSNGTFEFLKEKPKLYKKQPPLDYIAIVYNYFT